MIVMWYRLHGLCTEKNEPCHLQDSTKDLKEPSVLSVRKWKEEKRQPKDKEKQRLI